MIGSVDQFKNLADFIQTSTLVQSGSTKVLTLVVILKISVHLIFRPRLIDYIAPAVAVAEAAVESGVASRPYSTLENYRKSLVDGLVEGSSRSNT